MSHAPDGFHLFSFRGIALKLHGSLALLLVYVLMVSYGQFPLVAEQAGVDPGALAFGPLVWALVFGVSLLASIAIHEYGHALVGQALGVDVRGITLMMLGGMAHMGDMPERKHGEFKLAIIGPVVSLALGALLLSIPRFTDAPGLTLFGYWLGRVNIVLGVFNLLPAFPLDGGRALRSVLAARQGMVRATRSSVAISRGFAWFFGTVGLLSFNLLLVLIAFFIHAAGGQELERVLASEAARNEKDRAGAADARDDDWKKAA